MKKLVKLQNEKKGISSSNQQQSHNSQNNDQVKGNVIISNAPTANTKKIDLKSLIALQNSHNESSKPSQEIKVTTIVTNSKAPPIPKNLPTVPTVPLFIPSITSSTSNNTSNKTNIIQSKASILITNPIIVPTSNETSNIDDATTLRDTNVELLNEINNGHFKLKKVVTVEKTGIEYIKKKGNYKSKPEIIKSANIKWRRAK